MNVDYATLRHPAFVVAQEPLSLAIIALNSMSPCDAVVMTKTGELRPGYDHEESTLCALIPSGVLARQLTADGLSSYTGKELRKWADAYDREPLQAKVDAALQAWLAQIQTAEELLPLIRLFPEVASAELSADGRLAVQAADGEELSQTLRHLIAAL